MHVTYRCVAEGRDIRSTDTHAHASYEIWRQRRRRRRSQATATCRGKLDVSEHECKFGTAMGNKRESLKNFSAVKLIDTHKSVLRKLCIHNPLICITIVIPLCAGVWEYLCAYTDAQWFARCFLGIRWIFFVTFLGGYYCSVLAGELYWLLWFTAMWSGHRF